MKSEIYVPADGTNEQLAEPHFDEAGKVHDWRNHVGEQTKAMWLTFTPEQRRAIAADADEAAGREAWD